MEIEGTINSGRMEFEVDVDEIREQLEIMDSDDVEQVVCDWVDGHDFSDNINVTDQVESLLDEYENNSSPCSVGRSFEKAVWWAMGRIGTSGVAPPPEQPEYLRRIDEEHMLRVVREELLTIMNKGLNQDV